MKRFITALAVLAVASTGFVTACGQGAGNQANNNTNNAAVTNSAATSNNAVSYVGNQASGSNAASNASNSASSGQGNAMTTAQMTSLAKGLMQRYIDAHNDKTLQDYKVDITQILIPGLAQAVASSAKPGVDYNHPVKSSTVKMSQVVALNSAEIHAVAQVNVAYADGTNENMTYHLMLNQDQSSQQWYIRTIG